MNRRRFLGAGIGAALAAGFSFQDKRQDVRIGIVETLFPDIPEKTVNASIDQFRQIMERETGHTGESVTIKTYAEVADQLVKNKIQLGVMHGVEYAWVRPKYSELRPLVVAVNQQTYVSAILARAGRRWPRGFFWLEGASDRDPGTHERGRPVVFGAPLSAGQRGDRSILREGDKAGERRGCS